MVLYVENTDSLNLMPQVLTIPMIFYMYSNKDYLIIWYG